MSISRRSFFKAGSTAVLFAGFPLKSIVFAAGQKDDGYFAIPKQSRLDPISSLTASSFTPHLKTKFDFQTESFGTIQMTLVEVTDLRPDSVKSQPAMAEKQCFSLVFKGPRHTQLQQDVYKISHSVLGEFELMAVPVDRGKRNRLYQVIITR
jgi:hypothetical protein